MRRASKRDLLSDTTLDTIPTTPDESESKPEKTLDLSQSPDEKQVLLRTAYYLLLKCSAKGLMTSLMSSMSYYSLVIFSEGSMGFGQLATPSMLLRM